MYRNDQIDDSNNYFNFRNVYKKMYKETDVSRCYGTVVDNRRSGHSN